MFGSPGNGDGHCAKELNLERSGNRLNIGFADFHGDRSLDQRNRNHDADLIFSADEDALDTRHGTVDDADASANLQIRVRMHNHRTDHSPAQRFNLGKWNGCRLPLERNNLYHTWKPENVQAIPVRHLHKYITGK